MTDKKIIIRAHINDLHYKNAVYFYYRKQYDKTSRKCGFYVYAIIHI